MPQHDFLDAITAGNLHEMGFDTPAPAAQSAPAQSALPPLHRDPCLLFAALPALAWAALTLAGY